MSESEEILSGVDTIVVNAFLPVGIESADITGTSDPTLALIGKIAGVIDQVANFNKIIAGSTPEQIQRYWDLNGKLLLEEVLQLESEVQHRQLSGSYSQHLLTLAEKELRAAELMR